MICVLANAGLEVNESRPNNKLPYRGTWLQIGHDQVQLLLVETPLLALHFNPEQDGRCLSLLVRVTCVLVSLSLCVCVCQGFDPVDTIKQGAGLQIHLMELPNPDPTELDLRPEHGGRDRHVCVGAPSSQTFTYCLP